MRGLMQDHPLTVNSIINYAAKWHSEQVGRNTRKLDLFPSASQPDHINQAALQRVFTPAYAVYR